MKNNKFTLIEILIASTLMLIVFKMIAVVYTQTTRITTTATNKAEIYSELRIVLDLMSKDFQGYYPPAGQLVPASIDIDKDNITSSNDEISFPSTTQSTTVNNTIINLGKVKYKFEGDGTVYKIYRQSKGINENFETWSNDYLLIEKLSDFKIKEVKDNQLIYIELKKGDYRSIEVGADPYFEPVTMSQYTYLPQSQ